MINSAKILKLCNDIEDIVTDLDVHCNEAGWTECMEILSKIKQIGEELKETQACPNCGAKMYQEGGTISKERFAEIGGADND